MKKLCMFLFVCFPLFITSCSYFFSVELTNNEDKIDIEWASPLAFHISIGVPLAEEVTIDEINSYIITPNKEILKIHFTTNDAVQSVAHLNTFFDVFISEKKDGSKARRLKSGKYSYKIIGQTREEIPLKYEGSFKLIKHYATGIDIIDMFFMAVPKRVKNV